jgi:DNA polymerase III epsilon subunit-like protein
MIGQENKRLQSPIIQPSSTLRRCDESSHSNNNNNNDKRMEVDTLLTTTDDPARTDVPEENKPDSRTPSELCKTDRRRLKKLNNKLKQPAQGQERSGLLTRSEWIEYLQLEKKNSTTNKEPLRVGPSIRRRKQQELTSSVVDGTNHRDVLACLLKAQSGFNHQDVAKKASKKRSRGEQDDLIRNASLPAWANFHNPATVAHVVVLELHVPSVEEYESKLSSILVPNDKVHSLSVPTKWFQGPTPRSSSESLLYYLSSSGSETAKPDLDESPSREVLLEALKELKLTKKELSDENYPTGITSTCMNDTVNTANPTCSACSTTMQQPSDISLEDAKALIQQLGVRVENQDQEDHQLYVAARLSTPSTSNDTPCRVFGLDCEMVKTAMGSELARITLVEFQALEKEELQTTTILDVLVKPYNPVKDYVTAFSGITAQSLEHVTTRLEQVQAALLEYLSPQDILVGHSLENDLHAVRYIHPTIIDTAVLFRHSKNSRGSGNNKNYHRGSKFSLRHLSGVLLQRKIQTDSHCSEVDARTALELAVRRASLGHSFGIRGENRHCLLSYLPPPAGAASSTPMAAVCIGPAPWLNTHVTRDANGIHALNYESISDCRRAMLGWLTGPRKAQLVWTLLDPEAASSSSKKDVSDEIKELVVRIEPKHHQSRLPNAHPSKFQLTHSVNRLYF